jgi:hypothetical protein
LNPTKWPRTGGTGGGRKKRKNEFLVPAFTGFGNAFSDRRLILRILRFFAAIPAFSFLVALLPAAPPPSLRFVVVNPF